MFRAQTTVSAESITAHEPSHGSRHLQSGPHGPLGIIFMRSRPAEIGEHAVAHVFGNVAVPALQHFGTALLVPADYRAHVLGIEFRRQLSRPDQVDEHHRKLPAFAPERMISHW